MELRTLLSRPLQFLNWNCFCFCSCLQGWISSTLGTASVWNGTVIYFFQVWEAGPLGIGWKVISHSRDFLLFMLKLDWAWQIIKPYFCSWFIARTALSFPERKHSWAWRVLNPIRPFIPLFWSREITMGAGVWFVRVWNQITEYRVISSHNSGYFVPNFVPNHILNYMILLI